MKIALIGATGFVGAAILQEALNRRHDVTAIVRNPEKLQAHPQLHAQKGDVYNEDDVARFVAGHEVVISAFNPGWSNPDLYNQQVKGTRAIINGVKKAGIKRLLLVGGAGSLEVKPGVQSVDLSGFPTEYKQGRWRRERRSSCFARKPASNGRTFHHRPTFFPASEPENSVLARTSCSRMPTARAAFQSKTMRWQ